MRRAKMHVVRIQEGEGEKKRDKTEAIFKEMVTSTFPDLYKVLAGRIIQNPEWSVILLKETHTVGQ